MELLQFGGVAKFSTHGIVDLLGAAVQAGRRCKLELAACLSRSVLQGTVSRIWVYSSICGIATDVENTVLSGQQLGSSKMSRICDETKVGTVPPVA